MNTRNGHTLRGRASTESRARGLRPAACALLGGLVLACSPSAPAHDPTELQPAPIFRFEGEVQLRNGAALEYQAILVPDPITPGNFLGTIDIPKQAMSGATLQGVALVPREHVEFALNAAGHPRWVGAYGPDGTVACEFSQAGGRLPCSMREVNDVPPALPPPPHREQTPVPPYPYTSEDVHYVNSVAHVMLAGTLSVPAGPGPHPALVVVGDRGDRDRDGSLVGHRPWLLLADKLARAGIAALRLDPRGAAGSPPSTQGFDLDVLESDAQSGVAFLGGRRDIDPRRIGLLGHGFGCSVALRLERLPGVEFIVLLAPPALPGRQVLARQRELEALSEGVPPQAAAQLRQDLLQALAIIESEPAPERARQRLTVFSEDLAARGAPDPTLTLEQLLSLAATPGVRKLAAHDPTPLLLATSDPVLVLVPELDREIDPIENLPALRLALAHLPSARIETLPNLNHRFQSAESGTPAEYERLSETFAPDALERITGWIQSVAR